MLSLSIKTFVSRFTLKKLKAKLYETFKMNKWLDSNISVPAENAMF